MEFLESHETIFPTFISIIKSFYNDNDEQRISCLEFKINYFGGNYNNRLILMYLILMNDPQGSMRLCIIGKSEHAKQFNYIQKRSVKDYIDNLNKHGIRFNESFESKYLTKSITKFFLKFNRRIQVKDPNDLFETLNRLDESNLLSRESIEKLIEFSFFDGSTRWNQDEFKRMFNEYMKSLHPFNLKKFKINRYLQRFNVIGELHDKVMNRLKMISKEDNLKIIYFDHGEFPIQLDSLMTRIKTFDLIPSQDPFWYHILRLLFKWVIKIKELVEFEDGTKEIQSIALKIGEKIQYDPIVIFSLDLKAIMDSGNLNIISIFKELMTCEIAENPQVLHQFAMILERFYKWENLDCEKLEEEYFNKDFDTNQLLKFLIILHDPLGRLRSTCFSDEIPLSIPSTNGNLRIKEEDLADYITKIKVFQEPKDLTISNMNYITSFMIKSFLGFNKKFQIWNRSNLVTLIRDLIKTIEARPLPKGLLLSLIRFRFHDTIKDDQTDPISWRMRFSELLGMSDERE